ncbi:cache domain-containing protein [Botryobacter ruber]|uniref:cache domain-containing protein n=1 Tax=Botryobacter ruber TaxID=2171629 RepID=UPI000E0C9482|nr:cache domain-containing protein [Botryobacter ruber]
MKNTSIILLTALALLAVPGTHFRCLGGNTGSGNKSAPVAPNAVHATLTPGQNYQLDETRDLVQLVKAAADLLQQKGEAAFTDFRQPGSRWRQGESYIFVLDPEGNMLVHPDPELEGKNQLELKDINGKPIIRGLISAATATPGKAGGWYHYEWPVPGALLPRWKSSYVQLVQAPSGKSYLVGSGMYNNRMEKEFIEDLVKSAVAAIENNGEAAFQLFQDPTGPYLVKDTYVFVVDEKGTELVNPAFPNLAGRNLLDLKDTQGKPLVREMLKVVQTKGSGWVDYMWPKPGESISTQKSTYVSKAKLGNAWVMVGSGVYLANAPKAAATTQKMTAPELMTLVRDAAAIFEQKGEKAFPEFRKKDSRWFRNNTYFFVWSLDGNRIFHAADPSIEGQRTTGAKDAHGRPYGKMFLEAAATPAGEGWVHYMYPEPGDIFPAWKSGFIKRVTFPSGKKYLIGSAIYNMQLDNVFIEDVVNRAAALVEAQGKEAFDQLRDKQGPFYFMDTYVFVTSPDGTELVNIAQPSLEGKNLRNEKDLKGKLLVQEYIDAALKKGSAWVDYYWYKPGENTPSYKHTFVRKVQHGNETYIVGSGYYPADDAKKAGEVRKPNGKNQ